MGSRVTVVAQEQEGRQFPHCPAMSRSKLISKSEEKGCDDDEEWRKVLVWDLGTLECEHTLQQAALPQQGRRLIGLLDSIAMRVFD